MYDVIVIGGGTSGLMVLPSQLENEKRKFYFSKKGQSLGKSLQSLVVVDVT